MAEISSFSMLLRDPLTLTIPDFDGSVPGRPLILMSTRAAGAMTYIPNNGNPRRSSWLSENGIAPEGCRGLSLEHGKTIHCFDESRHNDAELTGDGIILFPGSGIGSCAVTVADCMPIFIVDNAVGTIGILHSGFKGTGILQHALAFLTGNHKSNPGDLEVILGPHIQACCYDIDEARAEKFSREFGKEAVLHRDGKYFADLRAANIGIARSFGITRISAAAECTACNPVFGSFRREGASQFTRMLVVIAFQK